MRTIHPSSLLVAALWIDAAGTGATAAVQLLAPSGFAAWTGLPPALLVQTGLFMAAYTVLLVVLARSTRLPAALIRLIACGNLGWAIGCTVLAAGAAVSPTAAGIGWLLMQAAAVVLFAVLQFAGMRSSAPARSPVLA